ncbi:hypothetical protein [[Bacillus] enclensis]|uniref:hypothetical protein n=1 Tax=[Bacillus] enclensis TaxID=1402860 RepID=UPI000509D718|nr:hypothetical protein [[Bacillus] enclensis]MBH9968481.1 hypothetical protein [[Bacillus] enclensis]
MNLIEARKRVKTMGIVAAVILGIQLLILLALITLGQSNFLGLDLWSLVDIVIGGALVIWLLVKKSRTAAVGLLVLYIIAQVMMLVAVQNPTLGFWIGRLTMVAIILTIYIRGVQGAFAYHRMRNQVLEDNEPKNAAF